MTSQEKRQLAQKIKARTITTNDDRHVVAIAQWALDLKTNLDEAIEVIELIKYLHSVNQPYEQFEIIKAREFLAKMEQEK